MGSLTPYSALSGGILIGIAVSLFLLLNGRIAGISGIIKGIFPPWQEDISWRLYFLAGLIIAPIIYKIFGGDTNIQINTPLPVMGVAGLLVGYGTSLSNGCTSGHGICGLSRLSPRALIATLTFMLTGGITVYIVRHLMGAGS